MQSKLTFATPSLPGLIRHHAESPSDFRCNDSLTVGGYWMIAKALTIPFRDNSVGVRCPSFEFQRHSIDAGSQRQNKGNGTRNYPTQPTGA